MKINKIYNIFSGVIVLVIAFTMFLSPVLAAHDSAKSTTVKGLETAANNGFKGVSLISSVPNVIGKIVGLALSFVGLAFFVLMIYAGFLWMFARGNDQDVQKAKDLIQAAVIGLIIVLAAYAITMFIGNALTSGDNVVDDAGTSRLNP